MSGTDRVFTVAHGRAAELVHRVKTNDPAVSTIVIVVLQATGLVSDATLEDYATLDAVLAGASNEATNVGYARKVLTDADIADITIDNSANSVLSVLPDQTWTAVAAAGGAWGKLLVCYYSSAAGPDTDIIPLTMHSFDLIPDGNDVIADMDAIAGFYSATTPA